MPVPADAVKRAYASPQTYINTGSISSRLSGASKPLPMEPKPESQLDRMTCPALPSINSLLSRSPWESREQQQAAFHSGINSKFAREHNRTVGNPNRGQQQQQASQPRLNVVQQWSKATTSTNLEPHLHSTTSPRVVRTRPATSGRHRADAPGALYNVACEACRQSNWKCTGQLPCGRCGWYALDCRYTTR
jgi:hypothetical protein